MERESRLIDPQRHGATVRIQTRVILCASAIVLAWYSHKPLYHSDLWGHLSYGRWMWEQGACPETEPLMRSAGDVPMIASAWLTQVSGFAVVQFAGYHGLQLCYALLIAGSFAFVCLTIAHRSRSALLGLVGGAVFILVLRWQLVIIRPQLVGLCCFTALLRLLEAERFERRTGVMLVILFVVWANAHPSFPAGLILLTIFAGVRFCQAIGSRGGVFGDRRLRWLILFGITAGLSVLLNPYGFAAYPETFRVSANPNLQDLRDWQVPDLSSKFAFGYLVSIPLVVATAALARQRRWEVLLAVVLAGGATYFSKRMLCWYAVLSAVSIGVHAASRLGEKARWTPNNGGRAAVAAAVLVLVAASPLLRVLVPSLRKPLSEVVAGTTPVGATDYLLQNYDGNALVWTPNTWGDFVTWQSDARIPVMLNSHAHLVPREVWLDYRAVSTAASDWSDVLDRRGIGWVVVDRRRPRLQSALERSGKWTARFRDDRSMVFRRVHR